jgi:preprotein translocase subunit SecF
MTGSTARGTDGAEEPTPGPDGAPVATDTRGDDALSAAGLAVDSGTAEPGAGEATRAPSSRGSLAHRLYNGSAGLDVVGRSRFWYKVTAVIVLIAVLSMVFRGFNYGIDFAGGNSLRVPAVAADLSAVREAAEDAGAEVASAQVIGGNEILLRTAALDPDTEQSAAAAVAEAAGVGADQVSAEAVSPDWGSDVTRQALIALVVFLVAVVAFLAVRFQPKMAVAALVALAHDIVVTAGIYALIGFEVTPSTVVGLLTILGFSLYDTVVVFDKVDENTKDLARGARMTWGEAANLALNQTLMRSINTSVIALLPVAGLLFVGAGLLGVGTLKDLALVLFIGLAAGTYSSIFLATPVLADLKEREPDQVALRKRVLARRSAEARQRQAGGRGPAGTLGGGRAPVASARRARRPGPAQAAAQGAGVGTTFADDDLPAQVDADVQIESPESVSRDGGSTAAPRPGARPQRPGQQRRPAAKKRR